MRRDRNNGAVDFTNLTVLPALAFAFALVLGCPTATTDPDGDDDDQESDGDDEMATCEEPVQLTSLDELMEALETGRRVQATLYYGECTLDGAAVIDAAGGMVVEAFEYFGEGAIGNPHAYVAMSKSSLVSISGTHYFDYVKVRVYEDDSVEVIAEYLDPVDFSVEMHEEFECELDTGDGGQVVLHAM